LDEYSIKLIKRCIDFGYLFGFDIKWIIKSCCRVTYVA